jgi:pteridine reductase
VKAIAPGAILWAENETSDTKQQSMLSRTPLARIGTPAEIAEAVRWLLRDATYTTGQVIRLDGGRTLAG